MTWTLHDYQPYLSQKRLNRVNEKDRILSVHIYREQKVDFDALSQARSKLAVWQLAGDLLEETGWRKERVSDKWREQELACDWVDMHKERVIPTDLLLSFMWRAGGWECVTCYRHTQDDLKHSQPKLVLTVVWVLIFKALCASGEEKLHFINLWAHPNPR